MCLTTLIRTVQLSKNNAYLYSTSCFYIPTVSIYQSEFGVCPFVRSGSSLFSLSVEAIISCLATYLLSEPLCGFVSPGARHCDTHRQLNRILAHGYLRCHIVISGTVMLLLVSSCSWLLDVKLWKAYLRQGSKILTTSRAFISGIRAHIGTTIKQFDCFIRDYETMNVMGLQKKVIPSLLYVSVCTGIRFK